VRLKLARLIVESGWPVARTPVLKPPAAKPDPPGCTTTTTTDPNTAIGKAAPITRLTNLPGQYN